MTGKKTHEQQQKIIEKRVDTTNADKDFDPRPYLNASKDVRDRIEETDLSNRATDIGSPDGSPGPAGTRQESRHNKKGGDPLDQPQSDGNG